jgi:hypothetical protein
VVVAHLPEELPILGRRLVQERSPSRVDEKLADLLVERERARRENVRGATGEKREKKEREE